MVGAAKWGDANQHRAALGPGKNLLGKLLVEVREEIKAVNACAAAVDVLQVEEQEKMLLSTLTTLDGLTAVNVKVLGRTRVALAVKPLRACGLSYQMKVLFKHAAERDSAIGPFAISTPVLLPLGGLTVF